MFCCIFVQTTARNPVQNLCNPTRCAKSVQTAQCGHNLCKICANPSRVILTVSNPWHRPLALYHAVAAFPLRTVKICEARPRRVIGHSGALRDSTLSVPALFIPHSQTTSLPGNEGISNGPGGGAARQRRPPRPLFIKRVTTALRFNPQERKN